MRWLFGCFGCGKSSSAPSDRSPAPLPRKQRNHPSHYTLPSRFPAVAVSSSPATLRNVPERSILEKHKEKKNNNKKDYGDPIVNVRTPERERKDYLGRHHPLSQLDELEAELEDLRKQIDRETEDARRIREEVAILKSRDTLRKAQQKPHEQFLNSHGESNSWFVSKSPIGTPEKISSMPGLKAYEPTPRKEFHSMLHGIDTPASNKTMAQSRSLNHSLQGKEEKEESTPYAKKLSPLKPKVLRSNDVASPDSQDLFDIPDECFKKNGGHLNREEGKLLSKYEENIHRPESVEMKKRIVQNEEELCSSLQESSEDVGIDDATLANESIAESTERPKSTILPNESNVEMHFFGCDTLSTISESEESGGSITSSSSTSERRNHENNSCCDSIDTEKNSQSISQCESNSISYGYLRKARGQTVSMKENSSYSTEEVSCDKKHENRHTQERYNNSSSCIADCTEELYSEESCSNSSFVENDTEEKYSEETSSVRHRYEDDRGSLSFSHSVDSEETVSELCPEPCFSPPISCSQEISGKKSEGEYSSSVSAYEEIETEQFNDLYRKEVGSRKVYMNDISDCDQTPLKLPECVATPPTVNAHEVGGNCSRLRNNRWSSSVLTPVENVSQWMQLKQRDPKPEVRNHFDPSSSQLTPIMKEFNEFSNKKERWDENSHGVYDTPSRDVASKSVTSGLSTSECMSLRVDTSFSHWAMKTTKATEADPIRVDTSLSHWLHSSSKKHCNKVISSDNTSSSEEGGMIKPSPQEKLYESPSSKLRISENQHLDRVSATNADALTRDFYSPNCAKRKQQAWGGQGIPNTTTKYKEDQRVKWYASPFETRLEKALYRDEHGEYL